MKTRAVWGMAVLTAALIGALAAQHYQGLRAEPASGQPAAAKDDKKAEPADGRDADRQAIRKTTDSFLKALEGGDAKAVAAFWTENGEYITDDGMSLRGRAAIEKTYADLFKKEKKMKVVSIDVESIRFLSKDTAVEEGSLKVRRGNAEDPVSSRYSVLHVREGDKWLMAIVKEWTGDTIKELDWLIGEWKASRDGLEITAKYEWELDGAFIRSRFTVKQDGETTTGLQIIGMDPATGGMRSWSFESNGGFGHSLWDRDGKSWVLDASGVQPDGSIATARVVVTRVDDKTLTWHTTERTLDGDRLPAMPPLKVTKVGK